MRNLAQRAAQAARETTGLIEDSVTRAKEGADVAGEVAHSLGAIVADVTKVTNLINGIAQASEEQAEGVEQVNSAVSQMDKVTQQNASGAEESASAAEELSAQAATVKGTVDELAAIIGGRNAKLTGMVDRRFNEQDRQAVQEGGRPFEETHSYRQRFFDPKPRAHYVAGWPGGSAGLPGLRRRSGPGKLLIGTTKRGV